MGKKKKQSTCPNEGVIFENGIDEENVKGVPFVSSDLQNVMEGVVATTLYYPCQDDNQQSDEKKSKK